MQIKKIENSADEDVAVIMSKVELIKLISCIGNMSESSYMETGVPRTDTYVIQPFYDVMDNYLRRH